MKKTLAKLVLFAIISALLSWIGTSVVAADDTADDDTVGSGARELQEDLADIYRNETACITDNDNGKLVSIIEEPLGTQTSGEGSPYEYRKCFRNTFIYTDKSDPSNKKTFVLPMLARECSGNAAKMATKYVNDKDAHFSCNEVQVIICDGGTCLIYAYIRMVYVWGASMVGIIAVLVIIISGIQISAAGGDPEAVTSAKRRILQSLSGIAVLFLSGLLLYTINPNFFTKFTE